MMVIDGIKNTCATYYNELPTDIVPAVAKSAFYTFTISIIFSTTSGTLNMSTPLLKAGVAALASTIHAIATPFFNRIFGTARLDPMYELVKSTVTAFAASAVMGLAVQSSIQITAFKLYYLISSNSFEAWFSKPQPAPFTNTNSIYFCF